MELSPDCARLLRLRIKMMNFVIIRLYILVINAHTILINMKKP